jgi:hypothetical protein
MHKLLLCLSFVQTEGKKKVPEKTFLFVNKKKRAGSIRVGCDQQEKEKKQVSV